MDGKMSNAPVYYALAQVRFNALAALDQYLPAIQDSLRKVGFPDFERSFLSTMAVLNAPASALTMPPSLQPQARYSFLNESRTSGFVLDQAMMFYQTTDYDTFEPFLSDFLKGLTIVHEAAQLSYTERVGVRFLDAVCPREGESLALYLVPSVLGLSGELRPRELTFSISETRTKLAETTLMSRVTIFDQEPKGAAFPFELQPINVRLTERFQSVTGLYAVIDTDSWLEQREKFSIDRLEARLRLLQKDLRRSFDIMTTPHAIEVWT